MNHSELIASWTQRLRANREANDAIDALAPPMQQEIKAAMLEEIHALRAALQAIKRVPMTEEQRRERLPVGLLTTEELYYLRGLRDAEAFHNITPPESKVSG